ncbi:SAM-dependent methyltransferase [Spirosoma fluminis]
MINLSQIERQFIRTHLAEDVGALLLKAPAAGLDIKKLASQIAARQKARHKLPNWYANDAVVFPPALSVEQASSERTAAYKASLVSGDRLLDVTGGMGVDSWAFASQVKQVIYVEQQPPLAELAAYNLSVLDAPTVTVQTGDGLAFVDSLTGGVDWLYLDPHRRDERGGKVVRLADCEPDISQADVRARLLAKSKHLLLKTSPLIDIDAALRQLNQAAISSVAAVHIVAVQAEVKEVLFVLDKQARLPDDVSITAVNLSLTGDHSFTFRKEQERASDVTFSDPLRYVYEPNAAVLKAGAFRLVAARYGLHKLAPHSHLYTSDQLQPDFPGRTFAVQNVIKPDRKALQALVPGRKANLTVRNFPQSVAELRKQLALQEGGNLYILATTLLNGDKRLLLTHKALSSQP